MAKMQWHKATKQRKVWQQARDELRTKLVPVAADRKFWRRWRNDKEAMQEEGYRCRKIKGKWFAWRKLVF